MRSSKMDAQLQQLIELQTKQNQLLEKHLWRFRFSLLTLLVLTTGICICLGVMIYSKPTAPLPPVIGPSGSSGIRFRPTNNGQLKQVSPSQNAVPAADQFVDPVPGK
jgi:hypothetical protein